jgi:hypothetical protein
MAVAGAASPAVARAQARGTQSFVEILAYCWHRPSLLGLELLWRWSFGIPLLALLAITAVRIWNTTGAQIHRTGLFDFSLQFPLNGAVSIAESWEILRSPVLHTMAWLLPVTILAWALAAGLGRNRVLRRYNPELAWRFPATIVLELLRILALCASFAVWFVLIRWAANFSLAGASPTNETGGEPNLVLYCALVIIFSLGIFVLWALLSWVFSIASLLCVLERRNIAGSLRRSLRLGPLTGKLIEINLVMNIVKIALIVLAMVFSATPLPFEAEIHGSALYVWWAGVTLLYLVASDFFQVARIAAFVELWKVYAAPAPKP